MPLTTGFLADPPDERDLRYATIAGEFGASVATGHHRIPMNRAPLDQGDTWSCVPHVAGRWWTTMADLAGVYVPEPSASFLYTLARLITAGGNVSLLRDGGTNIRNVLRVMSSFGVAPASVWPLDARTLNEQPCDHAFMHAFDQRVQLDAYYRLDGPSDIEHSVRINHPVMAGFEIHDGWSFPPEVLEPPPYGGVTGRHAVLIDEVFDDGSFGFLSSWGLEWGRAGRGRMSRAYVEKVVDPWTGTLTLER